MKKEGENVKTTEKDNLKGESDRPNSLVHHAITRQTSEGEISIHFVSRSDVLTDYHPLAKELVQKNNLRTHQVFWYSTSGNKSVSDFAP